MTDLSTLVDFASRVFAATGVPEPAARTVAEALVEADARGIASHGLMLVPMYVGRLRAGSVSTHTNAETVVDKGAIAVLDGRNALGVLTADQAMGLAVEKAKSFGVGAVVTRHAFHFGGAFRYAAAAARAGCIGVAACNTRPLMPAPGGATAVVGNNPVAVGVPGPDGVLLDMALSEAALGKIRLAQSEGREIPVTWSTDHDGVPTSDPTAAIAGLLLPTGGPKGYGLALIIDVLTGVLGGGAFGRGVQGLYADMATANDCSHFMLALDVEPFGALEDFHVRVADLAGQVRASRTAPGVEQVFLPGQREAENAARAHREGVALSESVRSSLAEVAGSLGVAVPEELR